MPRNRYFKPSGWSNTPTYLCGSCGKRTRDTGAGEGPVELCRACYIRCVVENNHADYGEREGHTADQATCPRCADLTATMTKGT